MPEYAAQAAEAFAQVREQFEETLGWLAGAEAGALRTSWKRMTWPLVE
jgi:hypothetical protein